MNFLGVGIGELLLILLIATIVVGPERMVKLSGEIGRVLAKFRAETESVTREFKEAFDLELDGATEGDKPTAAARVAAASLPAGDVAALPDGEADGAAVADGGEAEPGLSPEEAAAVAAGELEQRLASDMVDGELEVAVMEGNPSANGDGVDGEEEPYEDVAPIEMTLATVVPEDEDVEPTPVSDVLVIEDDEPSSELPVEAEE